MLKNIKIGDELEDGLIILDKFGGDSLTVKNKTGMGVVYIAFQKDTHQIFALKTFQDKFINDLGSISDFKLESFLLSLKEIILVKRNKSTIEKKQFIII